MAAIFHLTFGFHCYFSISNLDLNKIMPSLRLAEKAIKMSISSFHNHHLTICKAEKRGLRCWIIHLHSMKHYIKYPVILSEQSWLYVPMVTYQLFTYCTWCLKCVLQFNRLVHSLFSRKGSLTTSPIHLLTNMINSLSCSLINSNIRLLTNPTN